MTTRDLTKRRATAARYRATDKFKRTIAAWKTKNVEAVRGYGRTHKQKARAFIHSLKSVPCKDCGGTFDPVCMDFDHRPGEIKLFTIGSGTPTIEQVREEALKCDVICANCHRVRTYRKRDHGAAIRAGKERASCS